MCPRQAMARQFFNWSYAFRALDTAAREGPESKKKLIAGPASLTVLFMEGLKPGSSP